MSDQKCYKQVLFNLIGNSIKFTGTGDSITVRVRWADQKVLEKAGTCDHLFLLTEVVDTGCGIQQHDISKLFHYFGKLTSTKC